MRLAAIAIALVAAAAAVGCGSSSDEDSGDEAAKVVEQLKSLEKGEILIQGISVPRTFGPYVFERGGYVLEFEQEGAEEGDERLVVALQSKRDSDEQPYEVVVDSPRSAGTSDLSLTGKLYVHVGSAAGDYVLRFKPKQRSP